jgi:hypothetical protein
MQYVRNQCDVLHKHVMTNTMTDPVVGDEHQPESVAEQTQQSASVDEVVHRSCVLADAAGTTNATVIEDTDLSEDGTTDDEYDDDDQEVDTTDLVDLVENNNNTYDNLGEVGAEGEVGATDDTNQLVKSLLSTIVQQVEEDAHPTTSPPTQVDDSVTDESVEDFVESKGDYVALTETLRKKTVVELKKMCTEHEIGVKKGKSFKRKEELIEELVEKMPQQTA